MSEKHVEDYWNVDGDRELSDAWTGGVGPSAVPGAWADVCMFLKPPDSHERWKVRIHGALSIHHEALGIHPKGSRLPS